MTSLATFNTRYGYLAGAAICAAMLGFGLYLQHVVGLEPCPLCIFQRVAFIALGLVFLVAALHGPGRAGAIVYALLGGLAALTGAGIAARHVWLQNLPADQVPACGPGLAYMLEQFPLVRMLEKVLAGSGECAESAWTFFGLTIPGWSLLWFVLLGLFLAALAWQRAQRTD
jgi:disulfide bond formation protein DsbB